MPFKIIVRLKEPSRQQYTVHVQKNESSIREQGNLVDK